MHIVEHLLPGLMTNETETERGSAASGEGWGVPSPEEGDRVWSVDGGLGEGGEGGGYDGGVGGGRESGQWKGGEGRGEGGDGDVNVDVEEGSVVQESPGESPSSSGSLGADDDDHSGEMIDFREYPRGYDYEVEPAVGDGSQEM